MQRKPFPSTFSHIWIKHVTKDNNENIVNKKRKKVETKSPFTKAMLFWQTILTSCPHINMWNCRQLREKKTLNDAENSVTNILHHLIAKQNST